MRGWDCVCVCVCVFKWATKLFLPRCVLYHVFFSDTVSDFSNKYTFCTIQPGGAARKSGSQGRTWPWASWNHPNPNPSPKHCHLKPNSFPLQLWVFLHKFAFYSMYLIDFRELRVLTVRKELRGSIGVRRLYCLWIINLSLHKKLIWRQNAPKTESQSSTDGDDNAVCFVFSSTADVPRDRQTQKVFCADQ